MKVQELQVAKGIKSGQGQKQSTSLQNQEVVKQRKVQSMEKEQINTERKQSEVLNALQTEL